MSTLGLALPVKVVALLTQKPRNLRELRTALTRPGEQAINRLVGELIEGRVLRVVEWRTQPSQRPMWVFGVGDEPHALPPERPNGKPYRRMLPSTARRGQGRSMAKRFCALWHALKRPRTVVQLAQKAGIAYCVCRYALRSMKLNRLVHVTDWAPSNGDGEPSRLYVRGPGKDAPRPKPLTEQELNRRASEKRYGMELHQIFTFQTPVP